MDEQQTQSADSDLPAILGGQPIRADGIPRWPIDCAETTAALHAAIADGTWGGYHGRHCDSLRDAIAAFLDCEHVELACSGSSAVELALIGCKVRAGDEVVMSAYDYKANFANIVALGATPVLVDILPENGTLDVRLLPAAITPKTRAILVSHLHGGMADMLSIMDIARDRMVNVIEDACQVTGATVYGKQAGMTGDVGVWSFGGTKLLTAGRGGAVFSNNPQIMQRIKLHGFRGNFVYPLSQIQAAALLPQVARLAERNTHRAGNVDRLIQQLADTNSPASAVLRPFTNSIPAHAAYYKLGFRYLQSGSVLTRDEFTAAMRAEGVAMDPGFRAVHLIHSRRRFRISGDLPNAEMADTDYCALHHPVLLENHESIDQIACAANRVLHHADAIHAGVSG